jgi:Fe-S-cluster containining protein
MHTENDQAAIPDATEPGVASSLLGFAAGIYHLADHATELELARLRFKEGIVPSCRPGCFACCGQHVLATAVEARALVEYVRREFSAAEIRALKHRALRWHRWDRRRLQPVTSGRTSKEDPPPCPLLISGICSVYPMRPLTCRTHFVATDPWYCRPGNDPTSSGGTPRGLSSVVLASGPFSAEIRARIEAEGGDYLESILLLPHWLSLEMGWEFAPSF